jgi:hypothetical protein
LATKVNISKTVHGFSAAPPHGTSPPACEISGTAAKNKPADKIATAKKFFCFLRDIFNNIIPQKFQVAH